MIDLSTFTKEELLNLAEKLNIKPHHKANEETIIKQIMQQPMARIEGAINGKIEKVAVVSYTNTKEQVLEAIKKFTDKDGFEHRFADDNTWHFKYKGAEDSGTMSMPLKTIVMKAESVSRGAKRLLAHDASMFEPGNQTGSKAYTNNVLRV